MPFKIDRVPQGLLNLLATRGGGTPAELEDRVRASLELTQYYGLQQRRIIGASNAALAEGGTISAIVNTPDLGRQWAVLFGVSASTTKTATVTALRQGVLVARAGGTPLAVVEEELSPFGATETGVAATPWVAPYPLIMPPPWDIFYVLRILGTDATANCIIQAEIGLLQ